MHANTSARSQSGAQPSGGAEGSEPMGAAAFSYAPLQNGSDVRGVAIAGVPGEEVNLDRAAAAAVVKVRRLGLACWPSWPGSTCGPDCDSLASSCDLFLGACF